MHRRFLIDVVISDNPYVAVGVLHAINGYGRRKGGFRINSCINSSDQLGQFLRQSRSDGVIVMGNRRDYMEDIARLGKPAVVIMEAELADLLPVVAVDNEHVGLVAAEHLTSRGHRHFACYMPDAPVGRARARGFLERVRREPNVASVTERRVLRWEELLNATAIAAWLQELPKPLGLFMFNDQCTALALEACEMLGLAVPEDVSLLGVDNTELRCEFSATTLSSVDLGMPQVGEATAEVMSALLRGERPRANPLIIASASVVGRRSTDAVAYEDADVRQAVRFIHERYVDGIAVEDLVRHVAVSRSTLERKFKEAVGRLPGEEIRRVRLSAACALLLDERMDIADVAAACGYEYLSNFSTSFRQAMGLSPLAWRKRQLRNATRTSGDRR